MALVVTAVATTVCRAVAERPDAESNSAAVCLVVGVRRRSPAPAVAMTTVPAILMGAGARLRGGGRGRLPVM